VGVKERLRAPINPWIIAWSIGAILFALVVTWQNRGLTFFWDEWDVVSATLESPYYGILQDNGGNFFPLSRIVFGIELAIFGTWYPGYMFVTSLLFGATALAFNWVLDDGTKARRILLTAFSLIYLSSTGVLFASSMGFMLKWALSPLLAVLAAAFFIWSRDAGRNSKKMLVIAWLFFFLSWASFSSSIILMALLIVGLIHIAPQKSTDRPVASSHIKISLLILVMSVALATAGIRIAELNPPANPLIGSAQGVVDTVLSQDPSNSTLLALAAALAGLVSVVIAIPLHSNDFNSWLIIAFRDYLGLIAVLLLVFLGTIYAFKKSLPTKQIVLLFGLLFVAMAFITVTRTPFIHRYQSLWIPIAVLVVLSALSWLKSINLPILRNLVIGVVTIAAVVSSWHIGTSALSIANIEMQRDVADSMKLEDPSQCLAEATQSLDQIAPTISSTQLCAVFEILESREWILERKILP
jgi:hypothetical protein